MRFSTSKKKPSLLTFKYFFLPSFSPFLFIYNTTNKQEDEACLAAEEEEQLEAAADECFKGEGRVKYDTITSEKNNSTK